MSLTDTTSEADLPDILEANDDMSVSALDCVPSVSTAPNVGLNHSLSPPTSPYTSSLCDEQSMLDSHATRSSDRRGVLRSARSSPRHNAYSVPSREQRGTFKKHCRLKKHIFADDSLDPFISSAPNTVSSAFEYDQATGSSETTADSMSKKLVEPNLSTLFAAQCNIMVGRYPEIDTASNSMTPARTSNKSGLTIKIPSLVDRLALRLLGSCNVTEQTEEDEDADSLDGYSLSESSSSGDDDCTDFNFSVQSLDRFSRRKLRRHAIAPYHRAGKPRRKEWWLSTDEVPTFLVTPSAAESRSRKLRSGHCY